VSRLRVFFVCSGLGHVKRGYEAFFHESFTVLGREEVLNCRLFQGGGNSGKRITKLWCLQRNSRSAIFLGKLIKRSGYFVEQFTFFLTLAPRLILQVPDVICVSDIVLANLIRIVQRCLHLPYRVIFVNGSGVTPRLLYRWDHIQQVTFPLSQAAIEGGLPATRQTLLPHALYIPHSLSMVQGKFRISQRIQLGLPKTRPLALSVGAISNISKRMGYVINEISKIPPPRPYLLLLGESREDTFKIKKLGYELLSADDFNARTVSRFEVARYYEVADYFILASMVEGFGLVYVEALAHGLPCLVHDYPTSRYVLGEYGIYGDLSKDGELASMISRLKPDDFSKEKAHARHAYAYESFSWDRLSSQYVEMFMRSTAST